MGNIANLRVSPLVSLSLSQLIHQKNGLSPKAPPVDLQAKLSHLKYS